LILIVSNKAAFTGECVTMTMRHHYQMNEMKRNEMGTKCSTRAKLYIYTHTHKASIGKTERLYFGGLGE